MFGFHRHEWGELDGRYQRCSLCGKVHLVPCPHSWKTISTYEGTYLVGGKAYGAILRCDLCGEMKKVKLL